MKILVTGFNRFGNHRINPSQVVVEKLAVGGQCDLIAEVLPTEFVKAGERIGELIRQLRPERIICLGLNQNLNGIHLERVALNIDDVEAADNAGTVLRDKQIVPGAPAAYWSTLPIEGIRDELARKGIPAGISNHAGTFVCNHVFYLARHEVEILGLKVPCGFVHLPSISEQKMSTDKVRGLPLETIIQAVDCVINVAGKACPGN